MLELREDVYDLGVDLCIDTIIRDLWSRGLVQERIASDEQALSFGRRTLDVSTHLAIGAAEERQKGQWRRDWAEAEKLAHTTLRAMTALTNYLSGEAKTVTKASLLTPLRQLAFEKAEQNAELMIGATALLGELTQFSAAKGNALGNRTNPGEPEKAMFVFTMAQGWLALTGTKPGSNTSMAENPFMRFAAAGWSDAGGTFAGEETVESVSSFGQSAISSALQKLAADPTTQLAGYQPAWA